MEYAQDGSWRELLTELLTGRNGNFRACEEHEAAEGGHAKEQRTWQRKDK